MERLEGRQSVMAALEARQRRFEVILVSHQAHAEKVRPLLDLAGRLGVAVRRVDSRELSEVAHGASHGGVVAICSAKPRMGADELARLLAGVANPLILLLEGIDDARNLGFTLRSAEALGAHAVLVKKHLWDFDETEVARPASGAYERMPLVQIDTVGPLMELQRGGMRLLGCVAGARRSIFETDLTQPVILAIGGEKRGLSGAVREICDAMISIPTAPARGGTGTSLALSHAAAVLLGEAMRQRLGAKSTSG
jgi:23S rRNA (guanosine2251-2'-O)-methyltransferase